MGRIGATELLVLFVIVLPFYFIPTIIAFSRKKSNRTAVFILNFFLGWTFVGWIVSLVLASTSDKAQTIVVNNSYSPSDAKTDTKKEADKFDSLQKLKGLLDSGVLTQDEFEEEKGKILGV